MWRTLSRDSSRYALWVRLVLVLSLLLAGALLRPQPVRADSVTYTTAGSGTWTAPAGVTSITVEVWGGGGGGGGKSSTTGNGAGGGGGGAYARLNSYAVTPGASYAYMVGAAGTAGAGGGSNNGGAGGASYFVNASTLNAAGGTGGTGGTSGAGGAGGAAGATGDAKYSGGAGATGAGAGGGGGGGSGGSGSAGNTGSVPTGATAVTDGGPGGNGGSSTGGSAPASGPGGGGGGSDSSGAGGAGYAGQVKITYTPPVSTYATAGTYAWVAPAGVTSITVEVWGGGGGGGGRSTTGNGAGGGGGGAYARLNSYTVTPGNSYTLVVGAAGTAGAAGNNNGGAGGASYFVNASTLNAAGGSGGAGASGGAGGAGGAVGATGDAKYSGGTGATGATYGGGGGGSGGSGSAGNNGANTVPPNGAAAVTGGGPGGTGGNGQGGSAPASGPGGGGGGSDANAAGGAGYAGQVIVRYNTAPAVYAGPDQVVIASSASLAGTASDDGLPYPPNLTTTWSQTSGPGTTTFDNANLLSTTAHFTVAGTYVLRLTANDGALSAYSEVTIKYLTPGAPGTAPVQIYYVTLPEADGLTAMNSMGDHLTEADASPPMHTYFSISVPVAGTYIYYDQWEDGYASSMHNPTSAELYDATSNPAGVQIWGNRLAADGCAPNIAGVAVTCTDDNDILQAGNVIIPYNIVPVPRDGATRYAMDWFQVEAYTNNDGNANWTGNWVETNDDGSATGGDIVVNVDDQSSLGTVRFTATGGNESIYRAVDLSQGGSCATLSFLLDHSGIASGSDRLVVEVSSDGGANYTILDTYTTGPADMAPKSYPISAYASANTRVRFRALDAIESGKYWIIDNVQVGWDCYLKTVFDARDKIGASNSIAMSRAEWATGSGTYNAFAHEMYPTAEWGLIYESPVGTTTTLNEYDMFEYSALSIMASQNNTSVQIDADANGTYETTVTLNEGGTYFAAGTAQGARVVADKAVQVLLVTGDVDVQRESRDINLLPVSTYGTSYWSPVGVSTNGGATWLSPGPTRLYLYNPSGNSAMTFTCTDRNGSGTSGSIAARGVWTYDLQDNEAAHCTASQPFFAIGIVDAAASTAAGQGQQWDWSFTMYPDDFLGPELLVGLGLGSDPDWLDPLVGTDPEQDENGSPVWVTPVCDTFVYVDWNNDGTADQVDFDGDGTVTATNVDGMNETTSANGFLITTLKSVRLFEPPLDVEPYDQSGARIWSRTASGVGYGGTPGCNLAAAWGVDPRAVTNYRPGLDMGTSVPPLRLVQGTKSLVLKTDNDNDGQLSAGDVATYNITVKNSGPGTVANVYLYDTVPANTTYNTVTTQKDVGAGWVSIPDDGSGTPFPLDDTTAPPPDGVLLGNLAYGATFYVRFDVTLQAGSYEQIQNCDVANTAGAGTLTRCATDLVAVKDWGDLPDSYGTSAAANGPRHTYSGLKLGTLWDLNVQGIPTVGANGDDLQLLDDEDGVVMAAGTGGGWQTGSGAFNVTVSGGPGCLSAWMDFTNDTGSGAGTKYADGNFTKAGGTDTYSSFSENIISNTLVSNGVNYLTVSVPPNLFTPSSNQYYLRFRLTPADSGQCNASTASGPRGAMTGGEVEDYRFNLNLGTIGDYVWVDEDGDGDQDAGEVGIPNVTVRLYSAGTDGLPGTGDDVLVGTTTTDANGGYVFTDRVPGTYTVKVDSNTLPSGLAANPTYDEDGIGTAHSSVVSLGPGEEHMTADFGYNWSSPCETNTPGATGCPQPTGAIGDRVWVDADGDGKQDPSEVGIQSLQVQLRYDSNGDGVIDAVWPVDTGHGPGIAVTDANGNYIFDGLPAGIYEVTVLNPPAGYNQTGDPDHFGTTGTNDNKTTTPIVLGPGDVFLNADFGYQPSTAQVGTVGDYVWFDADAAGDQDAGEYGINGVTVALIKDSNGNGTWDAGEPIIATTITGDNPATPGTVETGWYQFTGLPASGTEDYIVWVNDTANVLGDLVPTYDNNGIGTPDISAVANLTTAGNLAQDFGYAPANYTTGEGLIGDFVWLDKDGDGVQDAGEPGLEGVTVNLLDSYGVLLATTVTDENGHYYFGDLLADADGETYQVQVVAATLPAGVTQTGDPDATKDNKSTVTLTTAAPVNLNQDFGYQGLNTISGTIWTDTNADSHLDGTEAGRFQYVTVVLRDAGGDIVATTTTDSSGNYSFTNLPDGTYYVDVTDDANVLNGYWKSNCSGGNCGQDNYSQVDPYPVTVGPTHRTDTTADFGYYAIPAGLGNYVWEDLDGDGIQDGGEPGIAGVGVLLTIVYPSGTTSVVSTTTDATGYYSFGNLLQDEDYNGTTADGSTEPTFTITVVPPAGYVPAPMDQGSDDKVDADVWAGQSATTTEGTVNQIYDFGFLRSPAAIGNYVWLDENSDGYQDAGEAGIPNVRVWLKDATGAIIATTYTDAAGGYIFDNLSAAFGGTTYYVDVDETTLYPGMVQTALTNPGADFGNQSQAGGGYQVIVTPGVENLTADFGFNYPPTTDVDNNTNNGSIGDRVWIDADGDGKQDPEEVGLANIPVTLTNLGPDGILGTGDDTTQNTSTDANGNYIFDNLPPGAYVVTVNGGTTPAGYSQSGDPDQWGVPCTACDNKTTTPILLGPGDVYVNADFGYLPTGASGTIGDTVWFDADADGLYEPNGTDGNPTTTADNEYGIPGVTVALIKDSNGDGIWDPDGADNTLGTPDDEPIIGQDTTDANGIYSFTGLPVADGAGTDDYLVWVNDTDNVLGPMDPTYDLDGLNNPASGFVSGKNIAAVTDLKTDTDPTELRDTDTDFGYTADNQKPGWGVIGDYVYIDRNGNGIYEPNGADGIPGTGDDENGLEGVIVQLYDPTGTFVLATTTTDENGYYYFGGLPPGAFVVKITNPANFLPTGPLFGMTYSDDPDTPPPGPADGISAPVALLPGAMINLDQDFGLKTPEEPGSIGNLIWNDVNADGNVDAGENGIGGVTVDLYRDLNGNGKVDPGEPNMGTATTKPDGSYLFTGLPTADNLVGTPGSDYIVDVTDVNGVLAGYWQSLGAPGVDNNSQIDPYAASISWVAPNNVTADFGYYIKPAALGNWVWYDRVPDGIQDADGADNILGNADDEVGIANVEVTLTITWPDATTTVLKTTTDSTGYYTFGNLLLDEDYPALGGSGQPTASIVVTQPPGYPYISPAGVGGDRGADSGMAPGEIITAIKGSVSNIYDYGFGTRDPTAVVLQSFAATARGGSVTVNWETASEVSLLGFNLYRAGSLDGQRTQVNEDLIPCRAVPGSTDGAVYSHADLPLAGGGRYYYWLAAVRLDGRVVLLGPVEVTTK